MAKKTTAVAYFRTSSATNVGEDKDSLPRQKDAVAAYAKATGLEIVREFYDAGARGSTTFWRIREKSCCQSASSFFLTRQRR